MGNDSNLRHTSKNKLQFVFNIGPLMNYRSIYLCNYLDDISLVYKGILKGCQRYYCIIAEVPFLIFKTGQNEAIYVKHLISVQHKIKNQINVAIIPDRLWLEYLLRSQPVHLPCKKKVRLVWHDLFSVNPCWLLVITVLLFKYQQYICSII